jgi:hypothetical protein
VIQDGLRHDRARGVSGAQKEDVVVSGHLTRIHCYKGLNISLARR